MCVCIRERDKERESEREREIERGRERGTGVITNIASDLQEHRCRNIMRGIYI